MEKQIDILRGLLDSGEFHHATYRCLGTVWEGLWFYKKSHDGFHGYELAGSIGKDDSDIEEAFKITKETGISIGSFGAG